jgi:hypothetical protein
MDDYLVLKFLCPLSAAMHQTFTSTAFGLPETINCNSLVTFRLIKLTEDPEDVSKIDQPGKPKFIIESTNQ